MSLNLVVVLISFRRPEMTADAIRRIVRTTSTIPILVSVDHPPPDEYSQDVNLADETWKTALEVRREFNNVFVRQNEASRGIIFHATRALAEAQSSFGANAYIILEEDQDLSPAGLQFLRERLELNQGVPFLGSAYSTRHHREPLFERRTSFPQLWGSAFNREMLDVVLRLIRNPSMLNFHDVNAVVHRTGKFNLEHLMASTYLYRTFKTALRGVHHFDGLLHASSLLSGHPPVVPSKTLLIDLGGGLGAYSNRDHSAAVSVYCPGVASRSGYCDLCEGSLQKHARQRLLNAIPRTIASSVRRIYPTKK